MKVRKLVFIMISVFISTLLTGCSFFEVSEEELKTDFHVGESCEVNDFKITYLASGIYENTGLFTKPKEDNVIVFYKFNVENTSNYEESISKSDFDCYADGYDVKRYNYGTEELSATIMPGRSTQGYLYYEIPQNAVNIELEYAVKHTAVPKKMKFIYDGEKDSGIVVEPLTVSPAVNVYRVGDTVEINNNKITYLSSGVYEPTGFFFKVSEGFKCIYIEVEVENTSRYDIHVGTSDFACYADGQKCESYGHIENTLSAELSNGRKTKGVVAFTIPENANLVEIEYTNTSYFSDRHDYVFLYESEK